LLAKNKSQQLVTIQNAALMAAEAEAPKGKHYYQKYAPVRHGANCLSLGVV
jgi:hypothetical protein